MRTTIDIDAHLLKRLRADAARRGVTFKEAVAGAIRRGLDMPHTRARAGGFRMPTFAMGDPLPGVNLDKALSLASALEDEEIPESLPRPAVDEDLVYVAVVVLYPGVDRVPEPLGHRLLGVNGAHAALDPADAICTESEEGAYVTLIFRTDNSFQFGRLVRGEETLFERVELQ